MTQQNFIRAAAACPRVRVADCTYNVQQIKVCIEQALAQKSKLLIFPELSVTGYTCGDLFLQKHLLDEAEKGLAEICQFSLNKDIVIAVGMPLQLHSKIYNCGCVIYDGRLLGVVPKSFIPNYEEYYEHRWFTSGREVINQTIDFSFQADVPFGIDLLFQTEEFTLGLEICEDLWSVVPPSSYLSLMGATIIGNLSASNEVVSKSEYRQQLVRTQSARCMSAY
ncbi:MAG: nitrilase-related carbon-nitrogen hydrolase, partial [Sporolactobacillus sp.]